MSAAAEAGVVRITTFRASPGGGRELADAAAGNAASARDAPGCLSAEVCREPDDPGTILVISRWQSAAGLQAFLAWHQSQAHASVAPFTTTAPHSVHYPVL